MKTRLVGCFEVRSASIENDVLPIVQRILRLSVALINKSFPGGSRELRFNEDRFSCYVPIGNCDQRYAMGIKHETNGTK
jgi:hypothetical protein